MPNIGRGQGVFPTSFMIQGHACQLPKCFIPSMCIYTFFYGATSNAHNGPACCCVIVQRTCNNCAYETKNPVFASRLWLPQHAVINPFVMQINQKLHPSNTTFFRPHPLENVLNAFSTAFRVHFPCRPLEHRVSHAHFPTTW